MAVKKSTDLRHGRYTQGGNTTSHQGRIGWWERRILRTDASDVSVQLTSKYNRRPDLLAFDAYGKSSLMWVILQLNNILDVNEEFVEGRTVTIPTKSRLQTEILSKTTL